MKNLEHIHFEKINHKQGLGYLQLDDDRNYSNYNHFKRRITEPRIYEPVSREPRIYEPVSREPRIYEPVRREPVRREPVRREPVRREPVRREPKPIIPQQPSPIEPVEEPTPITRDPRRRTLLEREPVEVTPLPNPVEPEPVKEDPKEPQSRKFEIGEMKFNSFQLFGGIALTSFVAYKAYQKIYK